MTIEYKAIKDLKPGDRVDLEGDPYADPDGESPSYPHEFCIVDSVEIETPANICVNFDDGTAVGFPPNHKVKVDV